MCNNKNRFEKKLADSADLCTVVIHGVSNKFSEEDADLKNQGQKEFLCHRGSVTRPWNKKTIKFTLYYRVYAVKLQFALSYSCFPQNLSSKMFLL